jgi:hypothetical protein
VSINKSQQTNTIHVRMMARQVWRYTLDIVERVEGSSFDSFDVRIYCQHLCIVVIIVCVNGIK